MPTITPPTIAPHLVPCEITLPTTVVRLRGIPGTQQGAALLRQQGLPATWRPSPELEQAPYAFVALGALLHAVWFALDRDVADIEQAACGMEFSTVREHLWAHQKPPCTVGVCGDCITIWRLRYS